MIDMLPIITNKETLGRVEPGVMKWALMDDGRLRILDLDEWQARAGKRGVPWDTGQLKLHGANVDVHR